MLKKTAILKRYGSLTLAAVLSLNTLAALPTNVEAANDKVSISSSINLGDEYKDHDSISNWAKEEIIRATEKGYINGDNGEFRPQDDITRSAFTKIIVSVLDLDTENNEENNFIDVEKSNWANRYITAASKAGIVLGDGNKFRPNDNITREQMAVIIVRALNLSQKGPKTTIKDRDKVSSWAKSEVETITKTGLMEGNEGYFSPKAKATREMAAVVAMRGSDYIDSIDVTENIEKTAKFMQEEVTNPVVGTIAGEWTVFGLSRSNSSVNENYYNKYYSNLEETLIEKDGKLHRVKYTEYSRVILALTSMKRDVTNVAGYNLLEPLADYKNVIKQGINGPIFALIALDSNKYQIPKVENVSKQTTRDLLVDFILGREVESGGWHLRKGSNEADPDITGMAIQALAPYYKDNIKVKNAVDKGVNYLSKAQNSDGGYSSGDLFSSGKSDNSESTSQVLVALSALEIDPHNDERFVKNGKSVVDALLSYNHNSGGFYHIKPGGQAGDDGANPGDVDLMATDQAMYAMEAYYRYVNGQNRLYDMTDLK